MDKVEQLINDEEKLAKTVLNITNLVARVVRNEGVCTSINEVSFDEREDLHNVFYKLGLVNPLTNSEYKPNLESMYVSIAKNERLNRVNIGTAHVNYETWYEEVKPAINTDYITPRREFSLLMLWNNIRTKITELR